MTVLAGVAILSAAGSAVLFTGRRAPLAASSRPGTRPAAHTLATTATTAPPAITKAIPTTTTTAPPPPPPPQSGCDAALAYLRANANPAFTLECPGDALGHEAMTCADRTGVCPGQMVIAIADPCPAAYMNEAANSWTLLGLRPGPIDPYGAC